MFMHFFLVVSCTFYKETFLRYTVIEKVAFHDDGVDCKGGCHRQSSRKKY